MRTPGSAPESGKNKETCAPLNEWREIILRKIDNIFYCNKCLKYKLLYFLSHLKYIGYRY